jgi:O-antigen/teichoic acid export membrane protein
MATTQNSFLKNSVITLTRQFVSILIGILLLIILARFLGSSGQGKYSLITLLPLMLLTFLNFGLNTSTIYYVSKKEINLNQAFNTNFFVALLLAALSIAIGIIVIFLLGNNKFENVEQSLLFLSLAAIPFMFLMSFLQTIFQGLQNFKMFNSILVVQQMSNLLLVILLVVIFHLNLEGAIIAFIFGYLLTVLFILYILVYKYNVKINFKEINRMYLMKSIKYGLKAHISNVMTFLNYRLDILLLGYFINPAAVGIYVVAVNVGERLSIFSQSISSVLLPRVASEENEMIKNNLTSLVSRTLLLLIVFVSFVLFLVSDMIFSIFFGEQYSQSSLILKVLLPGLTLLAVEKLLSNDLAGRGKPELNMYVSFFNVFFNVCLNLFFIPKLGALGAGISSTLTYVTSFVIKVVIFRRETGQSISSLLIIKKQDLQLYKNVFRKFTLKAKIR